MGVGKKKYSKKSVVAVEKSLKDYVIVRISSEHLFEGNFVESKEIYGFQCSSIASQIIQELIDQRILCGQLAVYFQLISREYAKDMDEYLKKADFECKLGDFIELKRKERREKIEANTFASLFKANQEFNEECDDEAVKPFFGPEDLRRRSLFCADIAENNSDQKKVKTTYKNIINQELVFADCRYITAVRRQLVREFPYAVSVIDTLLQGTLENHAAGKQGILIRPTVIHGLPGLGKSRLAKRVCDLMGVYSRTISIAGKHDNMIFGVTRGWSSASPSLMVEVINEAKVINPVIILDEIEKTTDDRRNGNIHETLLPLLEKHEAERWVDPCLSVPCDVSHVGWIFTANEIDSLPAPFRSRVKTVNMDVPRVEHLPVILRQVREDIARSRGLDVRFIRDLDAAERNAICETFVRHKSIRILVEQVKRILEIRKVVLH